LIYNVVSIQSSYPFLTLILLMWRIGRAPNNANNWQMGFISAFKGLDYVPYMYIFLEKL